VRQSCERERSYYRAAIIVTLLVIFIPAVLRSQTQGPGRQKIGIALSGGSALGLAHIGVLKYFEEHHIPIDYVAGTSMGGLVGGFYASGVSTNELERIVSEADWSDLLSPNPQFRDEPIVEKQHWNKPSGTLTLRFGRHFSLPSGISSGESLDLLFSRYTAAYANLATFDELPIPFRCVATDLVSADRVVLDRGSLPKALRATMGLPGLFAPVEWGNKVLVDGGLTENLPVETARDMGANIVIAVMFDGKYTRTLQFRSLSGVLRQTVSIPVIQNERRSASLANVVIRVHTGDISSADFEDSALLIQRGYDAAQEKGDELARFALSPAEWERYLSVRSSRIRRVPRSGPIAAVESPQVNMQAGAKHELLRKFGTYTIRARDLEYALSGITAATGVPGAYYEWQKQFGKPVGYRVELLRRRSTLFFLRPEVLLQLSSNEPKRGALLVGTTIIPATTYKSRYLGVINIGYDPGIHAEYYHPFGGSNFFVAPGITAERYNDNLYNADTRSDFQRVRTAASVRAGVGTGRFAQLSAGIQAGYDSYSERVTTDGTSSKSGPFGNLDTKWIYNTQDSGQLPHRGTLLEGSLGYSFRNNSFPYFINRVSSFHPVRGRISLFLQSDQASSLGRKLTFYDQFPYGGNGQLEAYRYQEFHANTLLSVSGGGLFQLFRTKLWSMQPRLAGWYELARLDLGGKGWQTHQSTSVGTFVASPVGTVGIALSVSEKREVRVRLSIGRF
jgi:NTE family protein